MREEDQICYDQTDCFFTKTPHSPQLNCLKQVLQQQFNDSIEFQSKRQMDKTIKQIVLLKVNKLKHALLYFVMAFKGKHFIDDMKQFQEADKYKYQGQRLSSVNTLAKVLGNNVYTPAGNPVTDLKQNTVKMFGRKDMLNEAVFNMFSVDDSKKLFFSLIQSPHNSDSVAQSFYRMTINFATKSSKPTETIKTYRSFSCPFKVNQQDRHCYVYFCQSGCSPQLKNLWIMALQSSQPSGSNIDKTQKSFEREGYIRDENNQNEYDNFQQLSSMRVEKPKDNSFNSIQPLSQIIGQSQQSNTKNEQQKKPIDQIQTQLHFPNTKKLPFKDNLISTIIIAAILLVFLYLNFSSSSTPSSHQNM